MATLYFICGGPVNNVDVLSELLGPNLAELGEARGLFDHCNDQDGRIGYVVTNGFWTFSGDADVIFRLHEPIGKRLSAEGQARALFGQTTAGYYEIVDFQGGSEISRTLDPNTKRSATVNLVRRDISIDDLWAAADEILPRSTEHLYDLPARWVRLQDA